MASHFTWTFVLVAIAIILPILFGQIGHLHNQFTGEEFYEYSQSTDDFSPPSNVRSFEKFVSNIWYGLGTVIQVMPWYISAIIITLYSVMLGLIIRQIIGLT